MWPWLGRSWDGSHIPGAKFVEVPGEDLSPFGEAREFIQDQIEAFLGVAGASVPDRVLATVMFLIALGWGS